VITVAAITTLLMFGGLTAAVFFTRKDFSFLRTALWIGGIAAFALILMSAIAGLHLGVWFAVAMVVLACGWILYDTSNVLHHYRTDQHVAASLALFASVALLFWYILQLFMSLSNRD
jgi:FtsH-binding integral membrane protein